MRILLYVLSFLAVVALSPLLINEKGYLLASYGNTTIETTIFAVVIMLVILFIALLVTLKVFKGGLKLSLGTWNKFAFASRRRAMKNFNKGIAAYILEDYAQAEVLLAKSAEPGLVQQSAYLLAAAAADKQSLNSNTDHYLTLLNNYDLPLKNAGLESVLVNIKLLFSQKKHPQARDLIDNYHKHIGHDVRLLSLEIDLCLIEKRFSVVVDYLVSARKEKALAESIITQWESAAFLGLFSETIRQADNNALQQIWKSLARKIKQREAVLLVYCQVLAENNITEPLESILLPALKKDCSETFLRKIRPLPVHKTDTLIIAVQKHLHNNEHSAKWLSCLGHLALSSEQWPMAERAFHSLIHLEPQQHDTVDLSALATSLIAQQKYQEATTILTLCLD